MPVGLLRNRVGVRSREGAGKSTGPFSRAAAVVIRGLVTYGALLDMWAVLSTSRY